MRVTPYPFERMPRVGRADAAWIKRLLGALSGADLDAAVDTAAALLGVRPLLRPGLPRRSAPDEIERAAREPAIVLLLGRDERTDAALWVVDVEPSLAACIVDRALGGDGTHALAVGDALDDVSQGVLGYVAARLLQTHGDAPRLRAVTGDANALRAALGDAACAVWHLDVSLGGHGGRMRLWITEAALQLGASARPAPIPRPGSVLDAIEITLCAHAARLTLTHAELAALEPGDVVLPDRSALAHDASGWTGSVTLHVEGARRTRWRCAAARATLTVEAVDTDEELAMTEGTKVARRVEGGDGVSLAGDAPIEVCVEIARFTLPLAELAGLRAGAVLSTGRAIGEHVVLRAGGRALAQAELVDLEGDLGIRVTEIAKP